MHVDPKPPEAILVLDRFPELRSYLLELLSGLSAADWLRKTAAPLWSVKDVVGHLLGGDIGILSRQRDGFSAPRKPIEGFAELVDLVNRLNAQWVEAARRISPHLLCELLAFTGPLVESYFASLDLFAMGGPVSWAGPDPAPVWLDVAREYTERWHHQQQIRDALGRPSLYAPHFFAPVLDTFARAFPYSFRNTPAREGAVVRIEISGQAGGCWFLQRNKACWDLLLESDAQPLAEVIIPEDAAWRLFTKGMTPGQATSLAIVRGEPSLAAQVFATVAVIA